MLPDAVHLKRCKLVAESADGQNCMIAIISILWLDELDKPTRSAADSLYALG